MELDPGIHIASTWFVLETGCDMRPDGDPHPPRLRRCHLAVSYCLPFLAPAADPQAMLPTDGRNPLAPGAPSSSRGECGCGRWAGREVSSLLHLLFSHDMHSYLWPRRSQSGPAKVDDAAGGGQHGQQQQCGQVGRRRLRALLRHPVRPLRHLLVTHWSSRRCREPPRFTGDAQLHR
jgi:hypothetical protein